MNVRRALSALVTAGLGVSLALGLAGTASADGPQIVSGAQCVAGGGQVAFGFPIHCRGGVYDGAWVQG